MGLDMFAKTTKVPIDADVDFDLNALEGKVQELYYWRKHPNLHGWMKALYQEKGGTDPDFDVRGVKLNEQDLDRLEMDIRAGQLPETRGFFFGESSGDDEEKEDDLRFVDEARKAIKDGQTVFYYAWW